MLFYLGIAAFELIIYLIYNQAQNDKQRKLLFILGCVGLWLFVGLRSNYTGADTIGYVRNFQNIVNIKWDGISEAYTKDYGFYYFVKLIRSVTDSVIAFKLITAFVSLIGVFVLCWNNTKRPVLALYFYVTIGNLFFVMTGMRQAIAMSLCMLAINYVQKRKIIPFVLLVLLAAQFHHSAYIFLPMYFLGTRRVDTLNMLVTIGVTAAAYFSYEKLLGVVAETLNYEAYGVLNAGNGGIFFVILLVVLVLALLTKANWMKEIKERVIMNTGVMCVVIWVFRLISRTAERPSMYWLNAIPVVLSESIDSIEDRQDRLLVELGSIALTFAFFAYRSLGQYYALGI